jgi:ABC-type multidrug transport system ATPase subunit
MLILQNISYTHPNKDLLFDHINLTVNQHNKIALICNNGSGKSTLLKIIAKELQPSGGQLHVHSVPYSVPQIFGQYNHLTVAQALKIANKLHALKEILNGVVTEENYSKNVVMTL